MPSILWTGKIGFFKKLLLNLNGMIAWISGNMKDTEIMKKDIKKAYNGDRSADVENYDTYGQGHYIGCRLCLRQESGQIIRLAPGGKYFNL